MKKKIFLIIIILFLLIAISFIGNMVYLKEMDKSISLKAEKKIIEYGEVYNPNIEELINLEEYSFIDESKIEINSNMKNEDGKEYPAVGMYEINVTYKDINLVQIVEVNDTTIPILEVPEKIEIENGTDLATFDFKSLIKVKDLSEVKDFNVNGSSVDSNVSGEYIAKISVKDIYDNTAEKDLKISVLEKQETEIVEVVEEINKTINKSQSNASANQTKKYNSSNKTSNASSNKSAVSNSKSTSNNKNSSSSGSSKSTTNSNSSLSTTNSVPVWCDEGGSKHWQGSGANEHGYYKTWNEAWEAAQNFMVGHNSGNYAVRQCPCGLYYFWVKDD